MACTHTHSGPDLVSELSNIFSVALTESEIAAGDRYRKRLSEAILAAVDQALQSLAPAQLGVRRRPRRASPPIDACSKTAAGPVLAFSQTGPVDHSVPVLRICDDDGKVRGVIFNYACHCTTLDGNYYRINADWAGYAAADLEAAYPDSVALCTIGCGADANPNPRGSRELSELHGRAAIDARWSEFVAGEMTPIDKPHRRRRLATPDCRSICRRLKSSDGAATTRSPRFAGMPSIFKKFFSAKAGCLRPIRFRFKHGSSATN